MSLVSRVEFLVWILVIVANASRSLLELDLATKLIVKLVAASLLLLVSECDYLYCVLLVLLRLQKCVRFLKLVCLYVLCATLAR